MATPGVVASIATGLCSVIGPFLGHSPIIAVVAIVVLAAVLFVWFFYGAGPSGRSHYPVVWALRITLVVATLVNIATLPVLLGFASPCAGFIV